MITALAFFILTLGVTASLAWPLLRRRKVSSGCENPDIVVYREQLTEVDNDIRRSLLTKAQAEAVRTEIHRRMLAEEAHKDRKPVTPRTRKFFAR